jgi:hypothetical protein
LIANKRKIHVALHQEYWEHHIHRPHIGELHSSSSEGKTIVETGATEKEE